MQVSNTFICLL